MRSALCFCLLCLSMMAVVSPLAAADDPPESSLIEQPEVALVLIDIQDFYFPAGALPLVDAEAASNNAGRLLAAFREHERFIVHVGHQVQAGGDFHAAVQPGEGEEIILKSEVNAFRGTDLHETLQAAGINTIVLCGMQTHMCLEGATRAAADLGYECIVVADACATRDLKRGDSIVEALAVHQATLATLDGAYAQVVDTDDFLAVSP